MNLDFSCFSIGVNAVNRDSFVAEKFGSTFFAAIADGVGKVSGSELASQMAVSTAASFAGDHEIDFPSLIRAAQSQVIKTGAQTTLTALYLTTGIARFSHVGDCRIYHIRDKGIITKTIDHTEVNYLIETGVLSKARAKGYHRKNVLLSFLGGDMSIDVQYGSFEIMPNDRVLLLSDGAYRNVRKVELVRLSSEARGVDIFSREVERLIRDRGLEDDATVIAIDINSSN